MDKLQELKIRSFIEAKNNTDDDGNVNVFDIICKNYKQISLNLYTTLGEEHISPNYSSIQEILFEESEKTNFMWYLLIKSADLFYEKYSRLPGENVLHENFEDDIYIFKECYYEYLNNQGRKEKLQEINFDIDIENKFFHEFCRNSNYVAVPLCSILGSMASQEIIKMITYQFKAVEHTIIFNGIDTTTSMFKI